MGSARSRDGVAPHGQIEIPTGIDVSREAFRAELLEEQVKIGVGGNREDRSGDEISDGVEGYVLSGGESRSQAGPERLVTSQDWSQPSKGEIRMNEIMQAMCMAEAERLGIEDEVECALGLGGVDAGDEEMLEGVVGEPAGLRRTMHVADGLGVVPYYVTPRPGSDLATKLGERDPDLGWAEERKRGRK